MRHLLSGEEIRGWEKEVMEKKRFPSLLLMERAAAAVVKELKNGDYDLKKILVVCGKGKNGGDGYAAARMLAYEGYDVCVLPTAAFEALSPETRQQAEMYHAVSGRCCSEFHQGEYTVIVDALLGIGCSRPVEGIVSELIDQINGAGAAGTRIVSVDIPSGLSADTGKVCGRAVRADTTVTFLAEKYVTAISPGKGCAGRVVVDDLGIPYEDRRALPVVTAQEGDLRLPRRAADSHKGTCGRILVAAGSDKIFGAAYLAAAGAYRIGAGLVKVLTPQENRTAMQMLLPEALLEIYDRTKPSVKQLEECLSWADAVVIGPGLGMDREAERILRYVLGKSKVPVVIDADGINLLAKEIRTMEDIQVPVVLTPHLKEMRRLTEAMQLSEAENVIEEAKRFTKEYTKAALVLKSAGTVVAKSGEPVYLNTSGNCGMATGGSGDVLAGMIGGLIGQGMEPVQAARLGVYLHGKAGDAAAADKGVYSMTATDILEGIAKVTGV